MDGGIISLKYNSLFSRLNIERVGSDLKKLMITDQARDRFLIANRLNRRTRAVDEGILAVNNRLSDADLIGSRRHVSINGKWM